jgi:hypothetical protein
MFHQLWKIWWTIWCNIMASGPLRFSQAAGGDAGATNRRRRLSPSRSFLAPLLPRLRGATSHDIAPQHLTACRTAAKRGHLVLPACNDLEFARVVVSEAADPQPAAGGLEVRIGQAVIPVCRGADLSFLRDVVQARDRAKSLPQSCEIRIQALKAVA